MGSAFRHSDKRVEAMNLFVTSDDVLTNEEIAHMLGVHKNTISRWRKDDKWTELRKEKKVTPLELATRVKKALSDCIDRIEKLRTAEDQLAAGELATTYIKELDYYSRILVRIDGWYDVRGSMLEWSRNFIEYLRARGEKEMLKELNRVMPEFYSFVETKAK